MKVLYFSRDYSPHDERFLTALGRTSHEVFFLRLSPSGMVNLPAGVEEVRLATHPDHTPADLHNAARLLRKLVEELKPGVVHAGPLHGPAYVSALAGVAPLASMSWGSDILHEALINPQAQRRITRALAASTVLICDCRAVAQEAGRYGFPAERMYLFPWGVDLAHFNPVGPAPLRERLGWRDNFVFISNRSFEPIYGVDVTLKAFLAAARQHPEIRLLVYGKGSQEDELRKMVMESGMAERVYFGGYVSRDELPTTYRSADLFISASHCDGSSVSLMEALACGRPAIVSDIPGNLEWVEDGRQGWVFKDGDYEALSAQILAASRDGALTEKSLSARQQAEAKADWERNFNVLLEAYEAAIELKTPAGLQTREQA